MVTSSRDHTFLVRLSFWSWNFLSSGLSCLGRYMDSDDGTPLDVMRFWSCAPSMGYKNQAKNKMLLPEHAHSCGDAVLFLAYLLLHPLLDIVRRGLGQALELLIGLLQELL